MPGGVTPLALVSQYAACGPVDGATAGSVFGSATLVWVPSV
jgi:hypothetical protein